MYTFITVLIIIVSVFLIITVLVQNSKGGGLAQNFGSANQYMGVQKQTDFLEKTTWTLAASMVVLSFIAVSLIPSGAEAVGSSEVDKVMQNVQTQSAVPSFGTPVETPADSAAQ